jgi:hypothetical protein
MGSPHRDLLSTNRESTRTDARKSKAQMNQPSREAMAGKLRIYTDQTNSQQDHEGLKGESHEVFLQKATKWPDLPAAAGYGFTAISPQIRAQKAGGRGRSRDNVHPQRRSLTRFLRQY